MGVVMQLSDRIGRRIKLQDLHILMTVVQAGSMGKAAERLNSTQPAISRSILGLEQVLGVRLLERHRQGVAPTEYGRALLDGGEAAFDELQKAVKNIEFLADPTAGEVRIGSTAFLAASFVPVVIDRLSRQFPRIVFRIVTEPTETLHRELRERKVDLLIVRRFGPIADKQLNFESLFQDTFVVAAGARSQWARRRKLQLVDLVREPWVLPPPESSMGAVAMEVFRSSGLDFPRAVVIAGPPPIRLSLLQTGRFLTIFPTFVLKFPARRPEIKVLPVQLPIDSAPNGIVTLKNRTLSPVAKLFVRTAREVAKSLAK